MIACSGGGSNSRPSDYETDALPTELPKQCYNFVAFIYCNSWMIIPIFGSCDHIGTRGYLRCSFHVIMFVGPLGDALSFGILCSVYKAGRCRSSGLGKKQVSLRHKRTKATQQELSNHILVHNTNDIEYVRHSSTLRVGNLWALYTKSLRYRWNLKTLIPEPCYLPNL